MLNLWELAHGGGPVQSPKDGKYNTSLGYIVKPVSNERNEWKGVQEDVKTGNQW